MSKYKRDRSRVDAVLRKTGVVVVMNRDHVRNAEDLVTAMWEVYQAGYVAECTFRIDRGIIREAMQALATRRAEAPAEKPFVLGVGSILNDKEFRHAIEMGFDMIVGPANIAGGSENTCWEDICDEGHVTGVFLAPAVFTPTELTFMIERKDDFMPDAIKIFPAGTHGPDGISDLLAPFVRERHKGRIIMPTGKVNAETGPKYQEAISRRGFTPVLGMSAPLELVSKLNKPGDVNTIRESLTRFREKFQPYTP